MSNRPSSPSQVQVTVTFPTTTKGGGGTVVPTETVVVGSLSYLMVNNMKVLEDGSAHRSEL